MIGDMPDNDQHQHEFNSLTRSASLAQDFRSIWQVTSFLCDHINTANSLHNSQSWSCQYSVTINCTTRSLPLAADDLMQLESPQCRALVLYAQDPFPWQQSHDYRQPMAVSVHSTLDTSKYSHPGRNLHQHTMANIMSNTELTVLCWCIGTNSTEVICGMTF